MVDGGIVTWILGLIALAIAGLVRVVYGNSKSLAALEENIRHTAASLVRIEGQLEKLRDKFSAK